LFEIASQGLVVVFETLDILELGDNRPLHLCGICPGFDLHDLLVNCDQICSLLIVSALHGFDLHISVRKLHIFAA
jgi:hypothetical protein